MEQVFFPVSNEVQNLPELYLTNFRYYFLNHTICIFLGMRHQAEEKQMLNCRAQMLT